MTRHQRGKTRRLNTLTDRLINPALRRRGISLSRIVTEWHKIAADAAAWSEPSMIRFPEGESRNGTLTVSIRSGRGPEMQMRSQEIVEGCNAVFGYAAISRSVSPKLSCLPQGTMLRRNRLSESHAPSMLIRRVASNAICKQCATMKSAKPLITLASLSSVRKIEATLSTQVALKHNMAVIDVHVEQSVPQVISVDRNNSHTV